MDDDEEQFLSPSTSRIHDSDDDDHALPQVAESPRAQEVQQAIDMGLPARLEEYRHDAQACGGLEGYLGTREERGKVNAFDHSFVTEFFNAQGPYQGVCPYECSQVFRQVNKYPLEHHGAMNLCFCMHPIQKRYWKNLFKLFYSKLEVGTQPGTLKLNFKLNPTEVINVETWTGGIVKFKDENAEDIVTCIRLLLQLWDWNTDENRENPEFDGTEKEKFAQSYKAWLPALNQELDDDEKNLILLNQAQLQNAEQKHRAFMRFLTKAMVHLENICQRTACVPEIVRVVEHLHKDCS